ncbi:MAG: LuxR family transcriptional regulator [Alphaproteobacteria bacterium]|jgi:DNA-binding CsgD family transcriptional regulator|nr:LuxR family transcriptional regulator [Alphaproteobacteria bacterium]
MKRFKAKTPLEVLTFNHRNLKNIKGVKFTPREIDVVACLLSGKGTKTVAKFLSIEDKTVETHKYNRMRKLECNSKEGIVDFLEKSDKFSLLKSHYLALLVQSVFKKYLLQIFNMKSKKALVCSLVFGEKGEDKVLGSQIIDDLELVGVQATIIRRQEHRSFKHLLHHINSKEIDCVIYFASEFFSGVKLNAI